MTRKICSFSTFQRLIILPVKKCCLSQFSAESIFLQFQWLPRPECFCWCQNQRSYQNSHLTVCLSFYTPRSDLSVFVSPLVTRDQYLYSAVVGYGTSFTPDIHACESSLGFLEEFLILGDSTLQCRILMAKPKIYRSCTIDLLMTRVFYSLYYKHEYTADRDAFKSIMWWEMRMRMHSGLGLLNFAGTFIYANQFIF